MFRQPPDELEAFPAATPAPATVAVSRGPVEQIARHVGLFAALLTAAFVAMRLISLPPTNLTAIWLPSGIALLAIHSWIGWRALPTIFVAHWAIIALANGYPFFSFRPWRLTMAAINTAGAALGVVLCQRLIREPPFEDAWAYLRFVLLVALLPAVLTAWMIPLVILLAGYLPGITTADFLVRAGVITMSNTLGVFLFVPIVRAPWRGGLIESQARLTIAYVVSFVLTGTIAALSFHGHSLAVTLMVPLTLASAICCGARAVGISMLTFAVYGLLATAAGLGPFSNESVPPFTPLLGMTLFALCVGIPGQFAGITLSQLQGHRRRLADLVSKRTESLIQSEERLRLALDAVTEGVFDWDTSQDPKHNRVVPRILGYEADEFVPRWRHLMKLLHPDDHRRVQIMVAGCLRGRVDHFEVELRLRTKHGDWRWLRLRARTVAKLPNGRAARVVGTVSDIDASKQQSLALAAAKEAAESADRAKSALLPAMSHEIRTPLHGVLGFARVLESSDLNEKQHECVDSILVSGNMLLTLLNDILDLSKIEAGAVMLDPTANSLRRTITDAGHLFAAEAASKQIDLAVTIADTLPDEFDFDALRVHQVVANLVGNAIKFTAQGRISVKARGHRAIHTSTAEDDERWVIECEVRDTGIGIAPEHLDRLFTTFGQADSSITRRYGGSGLGLAISRRLCELMGGTIKVSSEAGRGSTFTASFKLRRRLVAGTGTPPPAKSGDGQMERRLRILVAEDNRLNQRLAKMLLDRLGHYADFVANGREAVERVAAESYDLVLMDVQMPEMDGRSATRLIRDAEARQRSDQRLPIIAVTADAMLEDREKCLEAGMDAVLTKPLDPALFRETLARYAERE